MKEKTVSEDKQKLADYLRGIVLNLPEKPGCYQYFDETGTIIEEHVEYVDELYDIYKDKGITKVVGIESRGFVVGAALAVKLGAGFVMCRKPGKLPAETRKETYMKEYGKDTIEIHTDAITDDDVVLLHDDLLATGGSMKAAYNLVQQFNPRKVYINFLIELTIEGLNGRSVFAPEVEISTLMKI